MCVAGTHNWCTPVKSVHHPMTASAGKLGQHWCFKLGALLGPRGGPDEATRVPLLGCHTSRIWCAGVPCWCGCNGAAYFSHRCMHACRIVQPIEHTLPWGWGVKTFERGSVARHPLQLVAAGAPILLACRSCLPPNPPTASCAPVDFTEGVQKGTGGAVERRPRMWDATRAARHARLQMPWQPPLLAVSACSQPASCTGGQRQQAAPLKLEL